jgi:hypothetical protein
VERPLGCYHKRCIREHLQSHSRTVSCLKKQQQSHKQTALFSASKSYKKKLSILWIICTWGQQYCILSIHNQIVFKYCQLSEIKYRKRICKNFDALFKLKQLFTPDMPGIKTVLHIFNHTVRPVLLYGSEITRCNQNFIIFNKIL